MGNIGSEVENSKKSSNNFNNTVRKELDKKSSYAEIWWVMKVGLSHYSLRLCFELNKAFMSMFSDSLIAENFGISKTKCNYLIDYGFAVYFKQELVKTLKDLSCFVISYDKILNNILQEEQMELCVSFWDDKSGKVITKYFDS